MKVQEAIELLDNLVGMIEDNHNNDYDKALKMGIEALEKQDAKKVIKERGECYTFRRDGFDGYEIFYKCPSCGNRFLYKNYPCKCGQKLDWGA